MLRRASFYFCAVWILVAIFAVGAGAEIGIDRDLSGRVNIESRWFPRAGAFSGQGAHAIGFVVLPKLYLEDAEGRSFTLSPFFEHPNGETKLGQPMVNITWSSDWGVVEIFCFAVSPGAYVSGSNPVALRLPIVVGDEQVEYESEAQGMASGFRRAVQSEFWCFRCWSECVQWDQSRAFFCAGGG